MKPAPPVMMKLGLDKVIVRINSTHSVCRHSERSRGISLHYLKATQRDVSTNARHDSSCGGD